MREIIVLNYFDLSDREKTNHRRLICRLNRRTQMYHIRKFIWSLFR